MPYQCLEKCGELLLAARGSSIDSFSLRDGSLLSTWNCPGSETDTAGNQASNLDGPSTKVSNISPGASPPPAKRRRISAANGNASNENQRNGKGKSVQNGFTAISNGAATPSIIALAVTKTSKHVIAVTAEDKSIRVFESIYKSSDFKQHDLFQLSQRAMPKRPCAIAITEDDLTIISGDKFGDVYSLPVQPSENVVKHPSDGGLALFEPNIDLKSVRGRSSPAANTLTVHSQRNLKALENQKRHLKKAHKKTQPDFEHKLLLGHVSMLTDIALAAKPPRNYIITADRDEHIRVSRGLPQAHIIEGYCLGHTEFVSRLCVPAPFPNILISGGGDGDLFLWNWESGELLSRIDLRSHVLAVRCDKKSRAESSNEPELSLLTVSAIVHSRVAIRNDSEDLIIVICEGVPALFYFSLTADLLQYKSTITLHGNALAILPVSLPEAPVPRAGLVVSIDTTHKRGSTTTPRNSSEVEGEALQLYWFQSSEIESSLRFQIPDEGGKATVNDTDQLPNLLYSFRNLRKRDGESQAD